MRVFRLLLTGNERSPEELEPTISAADPSRWRPEALDMETEVTLLVVAATISEKGGSFGQESMGLESPPRKILNHFTFIECNEVRSYATSAIGSLLWSVPAECWRPRLW